MALNPKPFAEPSDHLIRQEGDNFRVPTGRGVLTAAEIEALLRPDIPEDAFEEPENVSEHQIEEFSDTQTGGLLHGDAAMLAARMTLSLRNACQVPAIVGVKQASQAPLSYLVSQYAGDPVLVLFQDALQHQVAGLTLDRHLAVLMIDRACGGGAAAIQSGHIRPSLSKLDMSILEEILRPLAKALDPDFSIAHIEDNRTAAHALLPPGKAMLAELTCQIDGVGGKAAFARLTTPTSVESAARARFTGPGVDHVMTSLTARIASLNVPISRLSDLKAGSVLLLGLPVDQPVEMLSGGHSGHLVAEGDVGRKGNKIAVRLTKIKPRL